VQLTAPRGFVKGARFYRSRGHIMVAFLIYLIKLSDFSSFKRFRADKPQQTFIAHKSVFDSKFFIHSLVHGLV
jgi:hypothetical protein